MAEYVLDASELKERAKELHAGDRVILSGVVYTSRDAAHKRIVKLIEEGGQSLTEALSGVDEALQKIDKINIDELNEAITDLKNVVGPLAKLFGKK